MHRSLLSIWRKTKLIVFDVDDTLLYTYKNGFTKINLAAQNLDYDLISFERFKQLYGMMSFEDCISCWFGDIDVDVFISEYRLQSRTVFYEPVCDFSTIQTFARKTGKHVGIFTNGKNDDRLSEKLKAAGVDTDKLLCLYTQENVSEPKPSGEGLIKISDFCKLARTEITYIGDSQSDYMASIHAGTNFIGVNTGIRPWGEDVPSMANIRDITKLIDENTT